MLVRRERDGDQAAIRAVLAEAFEDPEAPHEMPVEVRLVDALRASSEWLPPLAVVAESGGGEVAGYVVCTRGWVGERPALGLGPLAVLPGLQRHGAGSALMHAVLGAADALDEALVVLLGHTGYYPRFGFRPAEELGVTPPVPEWGPHFQARALTAYEPDLQGEFRYAQPFNEL
jgi:putative acetyltransferase